MANRRDFIRAGGAALLGTAASSLLPGCASTPEVRKDRKSTRLNSSHSQQSRMPSSA